MKKITRQKRANSTAKIWYKHYCTGGEWWIGGANKKKVYQKLLKLGSNPSPDMIDDIIGNGTWTQLICDECGGSFDTIVEVGQSPTYEIYICKECLSKALNLVEKVA